MTRIAASLALAATISGSSWADGQPPSGPIEEIVITGSQLARRGAVGADPVTLVKGSDLITQSAFSIQQIFQKIPAVTFQGLTSNQNSGKTGNNFAELRNLGPARTLILMDGRRIVPSNNITSEAVDIGAIPLALIERVEILRDGAAPIYGADAIGGVINFITHKNYDGAELRGGTGVTTFGDGVQYELGGTIGRTFANGNLALDVEHMSADPILQRNRTWARSKILDIEPQGSLTVNRNIGGFAIFSSAFVDPATGASSKKWVADGNGRYHVATTADRLDLSSYSQLNIAQDRTQFALLGDFDLSARSEIYGQYLFADRQSGTMGTPPSLGVTPITQKYPVGFIVPASAPGNPFKRSLTLSKTFQQLGQQTGNVESTLHQATFGVRGEVDAQTKYDVSARYGRSSTTYENQNSLNYTHAQQIVGNVPCSAADIAAGCQLADVFGPNSLTPAAVNYLRYTARSRAENEQWGADAGLQRDLFTLPAGNVASATGLSFRHLSGQFTPDIITLQGDQQSADATPTKGSYQVTEGFAEFGVPLLKELPAVKMLDVLGAVRVSDYSNFGTAVTWKATLGWQVTSDFSLRLARSTGVRAPSISELFLGRTTTSPAFNDPCDANIGSTKNPIVATNCANQGVPAGFIQPTNNYPVVQGGNPALKPERSQNWSLSGAWTPAFMPNFSLRANYFHILIRDAIATPNLTDIVQSCYGSPGLTDPLCALIGPRNPTVKSLTTITALFANIGTVKTDGVDLDATLSFDLDTFGKLTFDEQASFVLSDRQQTRPGGAFNQYVNTVDQPTSATNPGAVPRFRNLIRAEWAMQPVTLSWTTRSISGVWAYGLDRTIANDHTPHVTYHDFAASYEFSRYRVLVGVDNLANTKPPFYDDGTVNTSQYTYDVVGRLFYAKLKVTL